MVRWVKKGAARLKVSGLCLIGVASFGVPFGCLNLGQPWTCKERAVVVSRTGLRCLARCPAHSAHHDTCVYVHYILYITHLSGCMILFLCEKELLGKPG